MTREELAPYARRAQLGEYGAVDELLARMAPLIATWAKEMSLHGVMDLQEAEQHVRIGVAKAVENWDEARGSSFVTHAKLCGRRCLMTALYHQRTRHNAFFNAAVRFEGAVKTFDTGDEMSLSETIADPRSTEPFDAFVDDTVDVDYLERLLLLMTPLERSVAESRLADPSKSYEEAAASLGITAKVVDNTLIRVRRKAAEFLAMQEPPPPTASVPFSANEQDLVDHMREHKGLSYRQRGIAMSRPTLWVKRMLEMARMRARGHGYCLEKDGSLVAFGDLRRKTL